MKANSLVFFLSLSLICLAPFTHAGKSLTKTIGPGSVEFSVEPGDIMHITATTAKNTYIAFGFGRSMFGAEVIIFQNGVGEK